MSDEHVLDLIVEARSECKITWDHRETEQRIEGIVKDAIPAILHKLGIKESDEADLIKPGMVHRLFLKFCLYCWNDMTEEFERNYMSEILTERRKYEVKYEKEKTKQLQ